MAVAKSYEKMEIKGEPYTRDGKQYVIVSCKCRRCGGSGNYSYNPIDGSTCFACHGIGKENLEVRWYTDAQRAAMDKAAEKRKETVIQKKEENRVKFAARNAFGFGEAGFITILKGDNNIIQEWREHLPIHSVMWNEIFGWYAPSTATLTNMPAEIETHVLNWEDININELEMKSRDEVKKLIGTFFTVKSNSEYQGTVGDWLEKEVTIVKNVASEGYYGESHIHVMRDKDENEYVWTTAAKNFEVGSQHRLKMKVKSHQEYEGVKQTTVNYCKEI